MPSQVEYYNRFGRSFKAFILACPEPHLWTTDYGEKGRVYREMKARLARQEELIDAYFTNALPVLDAGCGFGRQAWLLAKKGYTVTGTDTSEVFIETAKELFHQHKLHGRFLCLDVLTQNLNETFKQVLLLDVLEHIKPSLRNVFMQKTASITEPKGVLLLSVPHVKKRWRSQVNNNLRKAITQHLSFFQNSEEHPYPVPHQKEIMRLIENRFHLLEFLPTAETDYYALERL